MEDFKWRELVRDREGRAYIQSRNGASSENEVEADQAGSKRIIREIAWISRR